MTEQKPTGWDDGLMQDYNRKLSNWLSTRLDAKHVVDMAQPEQEPVGFAVMERPWVGLTDEDVANALTKYHGWREFAQHLEDLLKEKNT